MDIVITNSILDPYGGMARVILEIARKFNPPAIYTYRYLRVPDSEFDEFNIIELGKSGHLMNPLSALKFYNLRIKEDYDVVNAHYSPSHWARNKNPRMAWYCHTPLRAVYDMYDYRMSQYPLLKKIAHFAYSRIYRQRNQKIVDRIEKIFANSLNVQARVKKYLGRGSEVLYPGIDTKEFYCEDYKKYFFYPSRIDSTKRFEYAIEAFESFRKSFREAKDFELIIAGGMRERDKKYHGYLMSIFGGKILTNISNEEMKRLYANSYAVLFAMKGEDFGLIPLEAMASRKPVISVNEGGPRETILDGKTGFLVNSPREMAEKMKLLAENRNETEKIGRAGRRHVAKNFGWKVFLDKFGKGCKAVSRM